MADNIVPDFAELINQQEDNHEALAEYLAKAESLAIIALSKDFLDQDETAISNYLWALCDLVEQARALNDMMLSELLKNKKTSDQFF